MAPTTSGNFITNNFLAIINVACALELGIVAYYQLRKPPHKAHSSKTTPNVKTDDDHIALERMAKDVQQLPSVPLNKPVHEVNDQVGDSNEVKEAQAEQAKPVKDDEGYEIKCKEEDEQPQVTFVMSKGAVADDAKLEEDARMTIHGEKFQNIFELGLPDPNTLERVTHCLFHSRWELNSLDNGEVRLLYDSSEESLVGQWATGTMSQREAVLRKYNECGIQIGITIKFAKLFGTIEGDDSAGKTDESNLIEAKSIANGLDSKADIIATFLKRYELQGVDIDFSNSAASDAIRKVFIECLRAKLESEDCFITETSSSLVLLQRPFWPRDLVTGDTSD